MGKKRKRTGGNKVKIGLVDCDSHNFPNLPLMKLSAYHKKAGDCVSFARMEESYDRLYVSKIFTESPEPVLPVCGQVIRGESLCSTESVVRIVSCAALFDSST